MNYLKAILGKMSNGKMSNKDNITVSMECISFTYDSLLFQVGLDDVTKIKKC